MKPTIRRRAFFWMSLLAVLTIHAAEWHFHPSSAANADGTVRVARAGAPWLAKPSAHACPICLFLKNWHVSTPSAIGGGVCWAWTRPSTVCASAERVHAAAVFEPSLPRSPPLFSI